MSEINYLYRAELAEQVQRYDEMMSCMKKLAVQKKVLNGRERNILALSCKHALNQRRSAWRILDSALERDRTNGRTEDITTSSNYKNDLASEMEQVCRETADIVLNTLLSEVDEAEILVFYLKMAGDYFRYITEFSAGETRRVASQDAKDCYERATKAAEGLIATNPTRLGLALNYSVFYFEVLGNPKMACEVASEAYESAEELATNVNDRLYSEARPVLGLLRDNLAMWSEDTDSDSGSE